MAGRQLSIVHNAHSTVDGVFAMLHARPALFSNSINIVKMLVVEVSWQSIADWTHLPGVPPSGVRLLAGSSVKKKKEVRKMKNENCTFGTLGASYKSAVPMHFTDTVVCSGGWVSPYHGTGDRARRGMENR